MAPGNSRARGFACAWLAIAISGWGQSAPPAEAEAEPEAEPIRIEARQFEYSPSVIHLQKGRAAIIELRSADTEHGFLCPGLDIDRTIVPGEAATLSLTPGEAGDFVFSCDVYCGDGHEFMFGHIIVDEGPS